MNRKYEIDNIENIESLIEYLETTHIVQGNERRTLLKLFKELFFLKEYGLPSETSAKWDEISKVLRTLAPKVNK
jgi:hypothetical protein